MIDDYGHHPVEMAATLSAVRGAFPNKRLLLAFQPHRYTRTRDCFGDFVKVIESVDALVLTDVYPAGEARITGADGQSLFKALRKVTASEFVKDVSLMPQAILNLARDGDVIITMGAGSVSTVAAKLMELSHG